MSTENQSVVTKVTPWRKGAAWWLVLGEGIILLAVGVLFLVMPQKALNTFGLLLAGYLAISGGLQLYASLSGKKEANATFMLVRGGIGLVTGLLILVLRLADILTVDSGVWLLAIGMLAYGLFGLYGVYEARNKVGMLWGLLINSVIMTLLALLLVYVQLSEDEVFKDVLVWLAILALIGGALLLIYGILLRRASKKGT